MSRGAFLLLLAVLGLVLGTGPVGAHESAPAGVVRVAQTLADRELTVTLTPPPTGTGRLAVAVEALGAPTTRPVTVHAETDGAATPSASVVPGTVGVPGRAAIDLDRAGVWEIVLVDGGTRARIPLQWSDPGTPGSTWAVRLGAAVAVVAGIAATSLVRRRPRPAVAAGVLAAAGSGVAVTAFVLGSTPVPAAYVPSGASTAAPAAAASVAMSPMAGMEGMVGMADPAMPMSQGPVLLTSALVDGVLDLRLSDSSTGAPVDDLTVHDDAFVHLALLGQDGSEQHLHPVRTAPGHWEVRPAPLSAGRFGVFAEFSRDGASHQEARSAVTVPGVPMPSVPMPGPGAQAVGRTAADVSVGSPVAGRPTVIRARFSEDGRAVTDLQPWLGMAGHLFVLGPGRGGPPDPVDAATSFAHVHDMQVRPSGRGYGPDVTFTYAFPAPGTYRLWLQVLRGGSLVTLPVEVPVG